MERREKNVLRIFHDQIESLWKFEKTLTISDGEEERDLMIAVGLLEELMIDEIPTPATYEKVIAPGNLDREVWLASMAKRRMILEEHGTWKFYIMETKGQHPIESRYSEVKFNQNMSVEREICSIVQGFTPMASTDYSVIKLYEGVCEEDFEVIHKRAMISEIVYWELVIVTSLISVINPRLESH